MADELKKKSPVPNPGSSSVSAPKAAPAPKTNPNPVNAPKPAANNFSVPKANPNPAPKPASNPVRQKIMDQGFKPAQTAHNTNVSTTVDHKKRYLDEINKYGGTLVGEDKMGNVYEVRKNGDKFHARTYLSKENDWPSEDDMSDIEFKGEDGNSRNEFDTFDDLVSALEKDNYPIYDNLKGKPNGGGENEERAKASELFGTDLTKPNEEQKAEEDFGYSSDNPKDKNLYDYLTQTLGHDDMTARGLVNSYKQGKEVAGLPRWKLDQISEGTADKNHWPFNVSK